MADPVTINNPKEHCGNPNKVQEGAGSASGGILARGMAEPAYLERRARFQALQLANGHNEGFVVTVERAKAYLAFLITEPAAE